MTCRLFTTSRATCRLVDSKVSGRRGSTWRRNKLGYDHLRTLNIMKVDEEPILQKSK